MTDKLISLSKVRKSRARADARKSGDANAAKFGRSKPEKARDTARADKAKRDLDGHRRDE